MNYSLSELNALREKYLEHTKKVNAFLFKIICLEWVVFFIYNYFLGSLLNFDSIDLGLIGVSAILLFVVIYFQLYKVEHRLNVYLISTSQILFSIVFTNSHNVADGQSIILVYFTLAFISLYRDFRPVVFSLVLILSYFGFGTLLQSSRLDSLFYFGGINFIFWLIFELILIFVSIKNGQEEFLLIAKQQCQLESTISDVEIQIANRTNELLVLQEQLKEQQQLLVTSSKMSALGEMAGGIAHEINTPLAVITMRLEQLEECVLANEMHKINLLKTTQVLRKTTDRIAKIVAGLRFFARDGQRLPMESTSINGIIEETLSLCREKFYNHGIQIFVNIELELTYMIECRSVEISQVILNLLNNSHDAILDLEEKWIKIDLTDAGQDIELSITDSGPGIPKEIQDKMMHPFFTTKEIGKGTGLGLSISRGIIDAHHGKMFIDQNNKNTCFILRLPKTQT